MNCSEAKLKFEPCVSGTLSPEERIELEEHLAICEGCRLELELTRAVMGAAPFELPDEPAAAKTEPPPPEPQPESRPQTALFDEMSFADLGSASPGPATAPGTPPVRAEHAPDAGAPDPFENFTKKPEEPAETAATTWDFEPVEVPRDASPPEGSLSFAHEALRRKREGEVKRKAALVRLALWGGGIGCGMVLLAISVWIALAFRQEKPAELPQSGQTQPVAPQTQPAPQTQTAPPAQPETTPSPNPIDGSAAPAPGTTQPSQSPPASSSSTPSQPAPDAQAPTLLEATPGVAPSPGPPPPDTKIAADGSTRTGSSASKPKPKSGFKSSAKPASSAVTRKDTSSDDGEFPWRPVDDPPVARTVTRRPAEQQPSGSTPTPPAPNAAAPQLGGPESSAPPQPAPVNPPAATPPAQEPETSSGTPAPQTQEPASTKPIDRLHIATETAAKNQDLATLRKLKSTWKSLIGSTAGPDRTRAKREYADCLWSIQEISGRNSDRREALAAYRDYVLYAPAGGSDPRTISRMRFLEDILTDSK